MTEEEMRKMTAPFSQVRFFSPQDVGPRIWGREILVAHVPGLYTGKILLRRKDPENKKRSMQFHRLKNETSYIYSGELLFSYDAGDGKISQRKLVAGDSVHIPPGAAHGEQALTDCVIFETSNPIFNDRMRVNELYGLPSPENSLPSTSSDEIEIR